MKSFKAGEIKEVIKNLLKKNRLKYSDLAEHLDCSEPTIKRILGQEELTLTRLLQICDFLKMSLSDLENLIQKQGREVFELSERQQKFLAENKNYFAYLMEIYQELTPEQIADKYKLTSKSTQKYLIGLEKHDLIQVTAKNRVRPFNPAFPHLGPGPLGTAYFRSIIQNASAFMIDHISEEIAGWRGLPKEEARRKGAGFTVQTMAVSAETFKKAMQEFELRLHELEKLGRFEEKTEEPIKIKTAVILLGSALVEKDYKGLQTLQKSFGEVVNF